MTEVATLIDDDKAEARLLRLAQGEFDAPRLLRVETWLSFGAHAL
jgi:hypothetical protein